MGTTLNKNKEGYGYCYTDLAEIHRYLEQNNLRYYQYVERIEGDDYVYTVPQTIQDDGEIIDLPARRGCRVVNAILSGKSNPAQEQGSALTYARRYSLLMAFGLATDDDDAESLTITNEPTLEDAKKYVLNFGKHNGESLEDVLDLDEDYIIWLRDNSKDSYVRKLALLLEPLPSAEDQKEILSLIENVNELLDKTNTDRDVFYKHYGVTSNGEMTIEQLKDAIIQLNKKASMQHE